MEVRIKLYGAQRCHKTRLYMSFFRDRGFSFQFFDVEAHMEYAQELRNLYTNKHLNFPTILIGDKKLRNPSLDELNRWIETLK